MATKKQPPVITESSVCSVIEDDFVPVKRLVVDDDADIGNGEPTTTDAAETQQP